MKSILVVGLLPGQAQAIKSKCRGANVSLRFVTANRNRELPGVAQVDHCIVMVKFVNHAHTEKALSSLPRGRVHYSRGGLNGLVGTIQGIADGALTRGVRHPTQRP